MEHEEKTKLYRFATEIELKGYVEYHRQIFLDVISGLEDLELGVDDDGAFVTFKVKEDELDAREMTIEAAAGLMNWAGTEGRIHARVKVEKIDQPSQ